MEKHPYDQLIETVADKMKQYETNKSNHFETNGDILARCLLRLKGLEMGFTTFDEGAVAIENNSMISPRYDF